jgi:hypothetical protein
LNLQTTCDANGKAQVFPVIMSDYIAYHSSEAMGHEYEQTEGEPWAFSTNKTKSFVNNTIGQRLWVITGSRGIRRTMVYKLAGVYTPSEVVRGDKDFRFQIRGDRRTKFEPRIEVTMLPWFRKLLREHRLSFGVSHVKDKRIIAGLECILDARHKLRPVTHILVSQNDFVEGVLGADGTNRVLKWILPKIARVGDSALLYAGAYGIIGRTKIVSLAAPAKVKGYGRYSGTIGDMRSLQKFVPLDYVRSEMPRFGWARYPRSYTTLSKGTAARIEEIIADYDRDNSDLESGNIEPAIEGGRRLVYINSYERSRTAREKCKRIHGTCCIACGFDFGEAYGASFRGYIHVHHLRQLADINRQYKVNPKTDLVPVCPNCHSVIHSANPPLSINEVQKLLRKCKERARSSC